MNKFILSMLVCASMVFAAINLNTATKRADEPANGIGETVTIIEYRKTNNFIYRGCQNRKLHRGEKTFEKLKKAGISDKRRKCDACKLVKRLKAKKKSIWTIKQSQNKKDKLPKK